MTIDDRDIAAFLIYASRERGIDKALMKSAQTKTPEQHEEFKKHLQAMRAINTRMLIQSTKPTA